jgi:hypothetical protein
MDPILTVGAGIVGLFFVSVAIVFLSSWILGRSRGYSGYSSSANYHPSRREFGELDDSPPLKRTRSHVSEEAQSSAMNNSLIQEILSVELPDEVPATPSAEAETRKKPEKPKDPLVSLIEEFDFTEDVEIGSETREEPEDDSFSELLGEEEEEPVPEILEEIEKKSYSSYPDCFGNERDCNRSCEFSDECRRTVEILGEFI